jgi:hypothetical protein
MQAYLDAQAAANAARPIFTGITDLRPGVPWLFDGEAANGGWTAVAWYSDPDPAPHQGAVAIRMSRDVPGNAIMPHLNGQWLHLLNTDGSIIAIDDNTWTDHDLMQASTSDTAAQPQQ